MDDGCEVLTLLQRGGGDAVALERSRDRAISNAAVISGIPGHDARVRALNQRSRIVPGTVFDDDVVVDAVVLASANVPSVI